MHRLNKMRVAKNVMVINIQNPLTSEMLAFSALTGSDQFFIDDIS